MAITKLTRHNRCESAITWQDPTLNKHYARLECIDPKCKHKKKHIQWLSLDDAITLAEHGVVQLNLPIAPQACEIF